MNNFIYSLVLHFCVLIFIFNSFSLSIATFSNETPPKILTTYLLETEFSEKNRKIAASAARVSLLNKKLSQKNQYQVDSDPHPVYPNPERQDQNKQDQLLVLLHTAIEKVQFYPESAQQMEREGKVTVEFILKPDGSISHLNLLHSSGTVSLDEAALEAVKKAVPFQHIDAYLQGPQKFNIDIVFGL